MPEYKYCKTPITWSKRAGRSIPLNIDGTDHHCKDGVNIPSTEKVPTQIGQLIAYDNSLTTFLLKDGKPHHFAMTQQVYAEWQKAVFLVPADNHPDVWLEFSVDGAGFVRAGARSTQKPVWAAQLSDPTKGEVKQIKTAKEILQENLKEKRAATEKADAALMQIKADELSKNCTALPEKCEFIGCAIPGNVPLCLKEWIPGESYHPVCANSSQSAGRVILPPAQEKPAETATAGTQEASGTTSPDDYSKDMETFKTLIDSVKRDGIPDLLKWLDTETDFYLAPSSTHFHDAKAGGLLHHSVKVYRYLKRLTGVFAVEIPDDSMIIIALFHDLCKTNFYTLEKKSLPRRLPNGDLELDDWGKKIWDETTVYTVNDKFPIGHGEKSVILLQRFIKLTDLEIMAIRWHMMAYDDLHYSYAGNVAITAASDLYRVIPLVHAADLTASFIELRE